ncbi:hypothetical protein CHLRE_05g232002v5 [Chlamydomonas reinhardtii]|uniref:Acyl-coenzyme A oxidase n=1 Tax=Chlamydomonas reinhardtii TaxID=3055 RepID=A0A2K3DRY2_CHLRE|nr:uncharacterized protein CHLRE_05g232002v5 [Chlamydomonas reinhardtii]PNW83293.1 hypothetical protein CHLRE_05g232002v5 [Chlamydomonas reinhardtii]
MERQDCAGSSSQGPPQGRGGTQPRGIKQLPRFDAGVMETYLDDMRDMKAKVYQMFREHPELLPNVEEGLSKEEHRELVRRSLKVILQAGYSPLDFLARDPRKYFYLGECLSMVDLSLMVKSGVQYSLWGGSVLNLGSEAHRRRYYDDIAQLRLPGCFAMTELKHGSNVAALQTEAVLDVLSDEWVVHTPDEGAIKWWIGNAAEDGRAATVFARLKVPDPNGGPKLVDHGVHAFVVPIRDANGSTLPGVEIRDCGYKVGLNGIDNGAIRFTHVRVPRGNLLDRFASVDKSGRYSSPLTSQARRFAATLGELTGGRVGLVAGSVGVLKGAVTIAVRYACLRQQFGPPDCPEVAIIDYQSTQLRLMPILATAYGLHFARGLLTDKYVDMKRTREPRLVEEVHALSAGLKAYTTSYTQAALSTCREACGGHGYAAVNRLGALRSDHDIFQTFEGDNTVLLQQVSAMLLKEYRQQFSGAPLTATYHYLRAALLGALPNNPLVTHDTEPRHLRDPAFLAKALEYRTARMLFTLSLRLRKAGPRLGAFHAWNKCLTHVLDLANAYVESVVYKTFLRAVEGCVDPECRRALKAMSDLFALRLIEGDMMFRNDEYIAPSKAKAISRLVVSLCSELRGVALPLVDAFAIPDHILRAPIGLGGSGGTGPQPDIYKEYLHAAGFEV